MSSFANSWIVAILVILCTFQLFHSTVSAAKPLGNEQMYEMDNTPISAIKRFYSWEDAKRAASIESEEGLRNKRKQFYAWAGKRSSSMPLADIDDVQQDQQMRFQKRKQFYAWAGK